MLEWLTSRGFKVDIYSYPRLVVGIEHKDGRCGVFSTLADAVAEVERGVA